MSKKPQETKRAEDAQTRVTTHSDGTFIRTAIVCEGGSTGSVDLVDAQGRRLGQINISYFPNAVGEEHLIVDVIDVEDQFPQKMALTFDKGGRSVQPVLGNLVSADFRRAKDLCPICGEDRAHPSQKVAALRRGKPGEGHRC